MLGLSSGSMLYIMILMFGGLTAALFISQKKTKDKLLCYFIRPNKQRIEKWVPQYARYIRFDRGKYGIERYYLDPRCFTPQWYDRGINKIWGTWIQTIEFRWDSAWPLDPETFEPIARSPEVEEALGSGEDYKAFAKATEKQMGSKGRFPEWFFPVIIIGVVLILLFLIWQMRGQVAGIEQHIRAGG